MDEQNKIISAIATKYPNASFTLGSTYDSLQWLSEDIAKPSKAEFDQALADYDPE